MKMAATMALSELAKETVPDDVVEAYDGARIQYGLDYLIPKPFDARVLIWEASAAVAEAAVNDGVAHGLESGSFDVKKYREELENRLGLARSVMRSVINRAISNPQRIVFSEGEDETIIKAAAQCAREGICKPILLGQVRRIKAAISDLALDFDCEIIGSRYDARRRGEYAGRVARDKGKKGNK